MPEPHDDHHHHGGPSHAVAWIALILSLIALALAITAYNRTGTDIQEEIRRQLDATQAEARQQAARIEARTELAALEAELAAGNVREETRQSVSQARANLAEAYADSEGQVRQEWQELDDEFDQIEQGLRSGAANTLGLIESLIERLRRDVATDNEG